MPIEQKNIKNNDIGGTEPKIFAMPEKFLGVLPGNKVQESIPVKTISPPQKPTSASEAPDVKTRRLSLILLIIGGIFAVSFIGAALYFYILPLVAKKSSEVPVPPKEDKIPLAPSITEEIPKEETAATTTEEISTTPAPVEEEGIRIALDSDGDGLTDVEEEVFGTIVSNSDTDMDGFLDGHEVFHLYNPAGLSPEKLIDTGAVKNYKNEKDEFQIYYPKNWIIGGLGSGGVEGTIINSGTGEFISIIAEENASNLPIISWYLEQAPGTKAGDIQTFVTKNNLDGIKSQDGFSAYFTRNGIVYIISYNIGTKIEINYKRTFEMMLNSFRIGL